MGTFSDLARRFLSALGSCVLYVPHKALSTAIGSPQLTLGGGGELPADESLPPLPRHQSLVLSPTEDKATFSKSRSPTLDTSRTEKHLTTGSYGNGFPLK